MIEILDFIRIKICIFCASIAASGFLLFNKISINIIFVILSAFSISAFLCALNNINDKEEDSINKKGINPLIVSRKGIFIIILFFILGLISTLTLPLFSIIIYLLSSFIGFAYSVFKLKRYLIFKNFCSGFSWGLSFLLGASPNFNYISFIYYVFISLFIFISSILSDLRDLRGDGIYKIKTIPVSVGYNKSKKIIYLFYSLFSFFILLGRFNKFLIFIPFCIFIIILINKNKIKLAHNFSGFAFVAFTFQSLTSWLIIIR